MAPLTRSRRLTCFYCGDKSSIQNDGCTRQWACGICLATNYLDENGEITDPPVAVVAKPVTAQYALPQALDHLSSTVENTLFCNDCIKNQHLVRSSLAQYTPEEKDTLAVDREYQRFKDSLENRYPQICGDCVHGVIARLKQSSYTAKTDHLRRLLDRSKGKDTAGKAGKTWLDAIQFLGLVLWSLGIYGQLMWNTLNVYGYLVQRSLESSGLDFPVSLDPDSMDVDVPRLAYWMRSILSLLPTYGRLVLLLDGHGIDFNQIAKWSLSLSLFTLWWSPRFKEASIGHHKHIRGLGDWYKLQALLILARFLFWTTMEYEIFNNYQSSVTFAAHALMLGFTMIVMKWARKSIRIDFSPLFAPTSPERLLQFVRNRNESNYNGGNMSQALKNISDKVSAKVLGPAPKHADQSHRHNLSPLTSETSGYDPTNQRNYGQIKSVGRPSSRDPRTMLGIPQTVPSLIEMTVDESNHYLSTGEVPAHLEMGLVNTVDSDAMEWKPEGSEHVAFLPAQAPRQSKLFSPPRAASDPSPFWYKGLPAAPISQEHKIRNPPNKARFQPASLDAKENFFNRLTGRQVDSSPSNGHVTARADVGPLRRPIHHEVELAPQKLFFPADTDAATGLEEIFNQSFTLRPSGNEASEGDERSNGIGRRSTVWARKGKHEFNALVLLLAWLGWYYSFTYRELQAWRLPVMMLSCCVAVALNSLSDCALRSRSKNRHATMYLIGAVLAMMEASASAFIIRRIGTEIVLGGSSRLQGDLLMGLMVLQEVCIAALL